MPERSCDFCGESVSGRSDKRFCSKSHADKAWAAAHAHKVRARNASNYAAFKALLEVLRSQPCTDCRNTYPSYLMEFDHVPGRGKKLTNIARMGVISTALHAELAKCDVVCLNCHALREHERRLALASN